MRNKKRRDDRKTPRTAVLSKAHLEALSLAAKGRLPIDWDDINRAKVAVGVIDELVTRMADGQKVKLQIK